MSKGQFVMLVGIAGSGKSTVAQDLKLTDGASCYISSDETRIKLFGDVNNQEHNGEVFAEMTKEAKTALQAGAHVIYDATNLNRKRRRGILQQLPRNIHKQVIYISPDMDTIKYQNNNRDRVVPEHAIANMHKTLQIPIYSEGWDEIQFIIPNVIKFSQYNADKIRATVLDNKHGDEIMNYLALYFREFKDILDMAQDSTYHSFSVSRHTYYVYEHVYENYHEDDREVMLWVALTHDLGKYFCKSFYNRKREKVRYANFIGHEYVSSQLAVRIMKQLGFSFEEIHKATTLIQFHMYLLDQNANRNKLLGYVGQEMFDRLEFLRNADTLAH
ncbi:polynucleotide kinase [Bacillus phage vB_BanS_Sophrita]|uniref:Polynucleotide kinase n=1 Tax=Bacillus phage vB_BanS_Sophrita TaxID=2894790 RepID=A0AAE8YVG0_9CAUD|nr:polynucleotide kinase [Bacillus phage vB_BanS_Sophrita]UGO50756.1 polynucleotide kinase [Bacillus phage vB_BanS_Sophrita]